MPSVNEITRFDGISRRKLLKASAGGAIILVAGCTARTADADAEDWSPVELDLDTLQAETPYGTMQAEAWENTYVGSVTDELFIGISLSEGTHTEASQEARIYLCDSDGINVLLTGEVGAETTTLEVGELSVELSFTEDVVQGTVIPYDGERQPFEAVEAGDDAGVFTAEATFDGDDYWGGWIVLPDGRQLGSQQRCFINPHTGEKVCSTARY